MALGESRAHCSVRERLVVKKRNNERGGERSKRKTGKALLCPQGVSIDFCILDGHRYTSSLERDCEILGALGPVARSKLFA